MQFGDVIGMAQAFVGDGQWFEGRGCGVGRGGLTGCGRIRRTGIRRVGGRRTGVGCVCVCLGYVDVRRVGIRRVGIGCHSVRRLSDQSTFGLLMLKLPVLGLLLLQLPLP